MAERRLSLLQAVSLNMSMMVGVGPFITIPAFVATMGGPQAMLGWILGAIVAVADGLVWCELAAAFPGSGGTYHYFHAAYGESLPGRMLRFLFVWQFLFSGPLEIATGAIGLVQYASYFLPRLEAAAVGWPAASAGLESVVSISGTQLAAMGVMVVVTALAYRRIHVAGRLMVVLWIGMLATVGWVIVTGLSHFDSQQLVDFPPHAFDPDRRTMMGLGMALAIAMYDFLGYYQVCYLGDEVENPARTIPRAILISVVAVAALYLTMNISILGVIPWREIVSSRHIASDLMLRVYGPWAAAAVTIMIIWTALASVFAGILGYSRIPYASARAGDFFGLFAKIHPTGEFPHRSLILIGAMAAVACLFKLETVIAALLTARILIQFVAQVVTVLLLRSRGEAARWPFKMPLYPVPALVALAGWLFVFGTSERLVLVYGLVTLAAGASVFALWARRAGGRKSTG